MWAPETSSAHSDRLRGDHASTRPPSSPPAANHHHLGFNIWRGRGPPAPHGVVGLRHWTIVIAPGDAAALRERVIAAGAPYEDTPEGLLVRDAWNIALRVAPT
jgi:catechol-2,3-dioxygenase